MLEQAPGWLDWGGRTVPLSDVVALRVNARAIERIVTKRRRIVEFRLLRCRFLDVRRRFALGAAELCKHSATTRVNSATRQDDSAPTFE